MASCLALGKVPIQRRGTGREKRTHSAEDTSAEGPAMHDQAKHDISWQLAGTRLGRSGKGNDQGERTIIER